MSETSASAETAARIALAPQRRRLHQGAQGELVLSYYPSGHYMAEHAHDVDQRSIILSGGLAEDTPSHSARPGARQTGFKAAGVRHENRYGPQGALILALNAEPQTVMGAGWGWAPAPSATHIGALVSAVTAQRESAQDALDDLVALLSEQSEGTDAQTPGWLLRVRETVLEDPDAANIEALAEEAGVHRVHLSRAYSRHFHAPISLDRRRVRMGRAVRALMEQGATAAEAAFEAGFADQPHFARTLKAETGLTPRTLMRVFRDVCASPSEVTSVQERSRRCA